MKKIDEALKTYNKVKKHGVLSDIEVTAIAALKFTKWAIQFGEHWETRFIEYLKGEDIK